MDRFIQIQGYNIHYVETGAAIDQQETMLLIPGAFSSYRSWNRMIPFLSQHYRLLAIDYLGAGDSDKPSSGFAYKIEEQADVIAEMMKQAGIPRAHIVGVSYGGLIALNLAIRYPKLVDTVVCIEGGVVKPEKSPYHYLKRVLGWPIIGDFLIGSIRSGLFDTMTAKAVMGKAWEHMSRKDRQEVIDIFTQNNKTASRIAWYRISQTFENSKDFVEEIKILKTPVLYLYGENSEWRAMAEMNVRFFRTYLPAVEIVGFKGGIHDLELQKPREVAHLIIKFLDSNGSEAAASRHQDAAQIPASTATP
ncbi:MAG: alpha/beta hydrolase [Desulfobacterales bacterium]|nr:alpha/beta hydrolase [Desulfobacterales bacterium]